MKRKSTKLENQPKQKHSMIRELSPDDLDKLRGGGNPPTFPLNSFAGSSGSYRNYRQ